MERENLMQRIAVDPQICGGKACIRGTRIPVSLVVDNVAEGVSEDEFLAAYPQLTHEDVQAALIYAAELTRERFVPLPSGPEAT
jgi:uncharacterized protein (DUF433 family)